MVAMSSLGATRRGAAVMSLRPRVVGDWREDTRWHRRMFSQARFRWTAEDVLQIASTATRGRLDFTTMTHLLELDQAAASVFDYADLVRLSMAGQIRDVRAAFGPAWLDVLADVHLSEEEVRLILAAAPRGEPSESSIVAGDVRRVLHGLPLPNPLTQIWELRQLQGMYVAAHGVLEDTFADLVHEVADRVPMSAVAVMTSCQTALRLEARLEQQRADRGGPGDPRRSTTQHFPSLKVTSAS